MLRALSPVIIVTALVLFASSCILPLSNQGVPESGTYIKKVPLRVMGVRRSYLVHIPKNYQHEKALPLVVVIHGAFSTARKMEELSGFSGIADRDNFIAVYPNGAFGILGYLQHWNAGHCCGRAADDNIDDVGFLDRVIAEVTERLNIDRQRIYLVGTSNGGMLAYRYAAERSDTVAAIATVAASIGGRASAGDPVWAIPEPAQPVPLITFHGRDDQVVPFEGGISPRNKGEREYFSVEQSMSFWTRHNKCKEPPTADSLYGSLVTRKTWKPRTAKAIWSFYMPSINGDTSGRAPLTPWILQMTTPLKNSMQPRSCGDFSRTTNFNNRLFLKYPASFINPHLWKRGVRGDFIIGSS